MADCALLFEVMAQRSAAGGAVARRPRFAVPTQWLRGRLQAAVREHFERLQGRTVIASGERATDLAVRLTYAEVQHTIVPDPLKAIDQMPPGAVEVIANYTAFRDLNARAAADE